MIRDIKRHLEKKKYKKIRYSSGLDAGSSVSKVAGDYCKMEDGSDGTWIQGAGKGYCGRPTKKS